MTPLAQISAAISALSPLPAAQVRALVARGRPLRLASGEFFCAPGETQHRLGFIHRGLVRYHVLTDRGDDVTKDFSISGFFTVSFGSAVLGEPARVAVSAVEETELTVWPWSMLHQSFSSLAGERFRRRVAELLYARKERRELSFLLRSATERYAEAAAMFGPAMVRIPQYQLASYLGIAPESLSRLRRRAKAVAARSPPKG